MAATGSAGLKWPVDLEEGWGGLAPGPRVTRDATRAPTEQNRTEQSRAEPGGEARAKRKKEKVKSAARRTRVFTWARAAPAAGPTSDGAI